MKDTRQLDFFVIGAQKAGTTSLHKYLVRHPRIFLPREKEAPYFTNQDRLARGWSVYIQELFSAASPNKLWGTVTPSYMDGENTPEYIRETCPDAKLIAIFRDPVDRAISHYQMIVRRGVESRSFEEAIRCQLVFDTLMEQRRNPTPENSYISRGEYGRIMSNYMSYFSRDSILVIFSDDLKKNPIGVLTKIYHHLGVENFVPRNIDKKYHVSAEATGFPGLRDFLGKSAVARYFFHMLPSTIQRSTRYWINQWHGKLPISNDRLVLSPDTETKLKNHFLSDMLVFERVVGVMPPWIERYRDRREGC